MKMLQRLFLTAILVASVAPPVQAEELKRVDSPYVCMVTDKVFEREQIPVDVDGNRYYGCCEMCKERLTKRAALRTAFDPQTKKPVDKAAAVIVAKPDGEVLYFESEETLEAYRARN